MGIACLWSEEWNRDTAAVYAAIQSDQSIKPRLVALDHLLQLEETRDCKSLDSDTPSTVLKLR